MKRNLLNRPRLCMALCLIAVAVCAAAPAVLLAAADAAVFDKIETVSNPYTAPTPTADDYYILRQLAAREQTDADKRNDEPPETRQQGPKLYISAERSLSAMYYADAATTATAKSTLTRLAECGAVPQVGVNCLDEALPEGENTFGYGGTDGILYDLNAAYCGADSLGFVTVRWFGRQGDDVYTRCSVTMDSRTGAVTEVWFSLPADRAQEMQLPTEDALRAFAAQAGLENLGDWAAPADSPYTCALYSANGKALIAASAHPYASYTADLCYYSLTLQAEV